MKLSDFLKDRANYIVSTLISAFLAIAVIWVLNPIGGPSLAILIGILYIIGAVIPLTMEYLQKKDFYQNLLLIFDSLDRKNLLSEMISAPSFSEGIILYNIIRASNKSMLEEINKYKFMQKEYREYIEMWVHEIKTPISSSKLIAQNNSNEVTDSMSEELQKIESYIEQVLFYSRSNNVEKDYIVREINLKEQCFEILRKNSKLFIQNKIAIITEELDFTVYSDSKWLEFILGQLLTNSVKYKNKADAYIKLSARKAENKVYLTIEDNGVGINESELPRIFEKGFTGTNGRNIEKSTGMGLYISKKLCDKLGMSILASSEYGQNTTITIVFPKSSMMDIR